MKNNRCKIRIEDGYICKLLEREGYASAVLADKIRLYKEEGYTRLYDSELEYMIDALVRKLQEYEEKIHKLEG